MANSNSQPSNTRTPRVTIAIIPREQFSVTLQALDSLYEQTKEPFELIYVDSASPRKLRRELERRAQHATGRFRILRTEEAIGSNTARNLALREATGEYVVFLDNDIVVGPGWLPPLVECADATNAVAVMPLVLERTGARERVHLSGGTLTIRSDHQVEVVMRDFGRDIDATRAERHGWEETALVEHHCLLVRPGPLLDIGAFDNEIVPAWEHIDFCLSVGRAGGHLYVEPSSVVTYVSPTDHRWSNLPRFRFQWSESRHRSGMKKFCDKWAVSDNYPPELLFERHGQNIFHSTLTRRFGRALRHVLPQRAFEALRRIYAAADPALNRVVRRTLLS